MKDVLLVVDDLPINRLILHEILSDDYSVVEAEDGYRALEILKNCESLPQAILLDIMMPEMDGFTVLQHIKEDPRLKSIPVLFITAADHEVNETKGLKEGAMDYIQKPFNPDVVKARVDNHVQLHHYQTDLESMVEKKASELVEMHEKMLETLATIIEYRSLESGEHIKRTCELTKILIRKLLEKPQFAKELIELDYESIIKASALHDIGKVAIPDSILLKPGKLLPWEFDVIKTHSTIGSDIIDAMNLNVTTQFVKHCREICRHHHERWNGSGYPDGLKGEGIPLAARIITLVDVYDALVSKRCYKPEYSKEETFNIILEGKGTQFQPEIVDAFMEVEDQFEELEMAMKDVIR